MTKEGIWKWTKKRRWLLVWKSQRSGWMRKKEAPSILNIWETNVLVGQAVCLGNEYMR